MEKPDLNITDRIDARNKLSDFIFAETLTRGEVVDQSGENFVVIQYADESLQKFVYNLDYNEYEILGIPKKLKFK